MNRTIISIEVQDEGGKDAFIVLPAFKKYKFSHYLYKVLWDKLFRK